MTSTRLHLALLLCLPTALAGCIVKEAQSADINAYGYVGVINYNHNRTYFFTLYDLMVEGQPVISAGVAWPLASDGINCCIALPAKWRPGIKVLLEWTEYDHTPVIAGDNPEIHRDVIGKHKQEMEIPRYEKVAYLHVTFLPKGKVELVISQFEPSAPEWQGSINQTPWNYCVEKNEPQLCKLASSRFDIDVGRGICTVAKRTGIEYFERDGQQFSYCKQAMLDCMNNLDDQDLCNRVLWAKERKGFR